MDKKNEIRCICARHPLLAVYGVDKKTKELYIHVKVYKQSRLYAEIFVSADANVRLTCRECLRVHKVKIVSGRFSLEEQKEVMELLALESGQPQVAPDHNVG